MVVIIINTGHLGQPISGTVCLLVSAQPRLYIHEPKCNVQNNTPIIPPVAPSALSAFYLIETVLG